MLIIKEDFFPRNQWQLGQIVETAVDGNGLVHSVVGGKDFIKPHSKVKPTVVERPVQKLVLLVESQ